MTPQTPPKWFQATWFTIVTLIFVPPVGLFFLWRYRSWPHKLKWQVTAAAAIWFLLVNRSGSPTNAPVNRGATVSSQSAGTAPKNISSLRAAPRTTTAQPKRIVASPAPFTRTAEQTVKDLMKEQFGQRLRQAKVASLKDGSYSVKIQFDNKLRFTDRATLNYMKGDMKDAYKNLYTSGVKISSVNLEAYGSGTDAYGNNVSSPAYQTILKGDVASKINWDNYRSARWDDLWDVVFVHKQYATGSSLVTKSSPVTGNNPVVSKEAPPETNTLIWDIPSLLKTSRAEAGAVLGEPQQHHFDDKPGEFSDNYSIWDKGETTLFIRFTPDNNKPLEIQLNFSTAKYPTSREMAMSAGNLKRRDSRYKLEFSEVKENGEVKGYSSVKAVLK